MIDAENLKSNTIIETDYLIVGSGPGGSIGAYNLSKDNKVIVIEQGPYKKASDFESEYMAYKDLYQEGNARTTKDKGIRILQGRAIGGSALVNWTTCFRTPAPTLKHWEEEYGINFSDKLNFESIENNLNVSKWHMDPNPNNGKLRDACQKMGWDWNVISRNVKGCANLGLCGVGCPTNAKQAPHLSYLKDAKKNGAIVYSNLKAIRLDWKEDQVNGLLCKSRISEKDIYIKAKKVIISAGAIGTPALMLRSKLKDPNKKIGKRTFLHPTCLVAGLYDEIIEGAKGAPQSIYSDEFLKRSPSLSMGYKLEAAPIYPIIFATAFADHGENHANLMKLRPNTAAHIALMRDGFHPESSGGSVELDKFENALLDYKISDYVWNGLKEAMMNMVKGHFKAGARKVYPGLGTSKFYETEAKAMDAVNEAKLEALQFPVFSAHVMGGSTMSNDESKSVVNLEGKVHGYKNLYVMDGSLFPTSVAANPMISIYAFADYLSRKLI